MNNVAVVQQVMRELGEVYRSDWSDFGGRTLRTELDVLAGFLDEDAGPVAIEDLRDRLFIEVDDDGSVQWAKW
jgi:hypothetical protein